MIDSKYIKHPYYCENCNSMTPHLAMSSSVEEQKEQAESESKTVENRDVSGVYRKPVL